MWRCLEGVRQRQRTDGKTHFQASLLLSPNHTPFLVTNPNMASSLPITPSVSLSHYNHFWSLSPLDKLMNKAQGKQIIETSSAPFLELSHPSLRGVLHWPVGPHLEHQALVLVTHFGRGVVPLEVTLRPVSRMVIPERD